MCAVHLGLKAVSICFVDFHPKQMSRRGGAIHATWRILVDGDTAGDSVLEALRRCAPTLDPYGATLALKGLMA